MKIVKEAPLEEFINQYLAGNDKVRHKIDAILPRLELEKKSTICEIEMILNRVEKINKAVHSFFGQLSHEQADVDSVLHDMFRNHEIDNELKQDIVKAISDLSQMSEMDNVYSEEIEYFDNNDPCKLINVILEYIIY